MKSILKINYLILSLILVGPGITSVVTAQNTPNRHVAYGILNLENKVEWGIANMTMMKNLGCNAVQISIRWDYIYPTANSEPDWRQIDNQVNHAVKNLNQKVAFRIHLGREFSKTKGFWTEVESVKDFRGENLTVYYNNNHFSFAASNPLDKAKKFVAEVCERYKYLQDSGNLLFISTVNTPQQEAGYTYENTPPKTEPYTAVYDHSEWSMIKWREFLVKKYKTPERLSLYWGEKFSSFNKADPYVNWWNTKASFRGQRGKDWYYFRHNLFKNYMDELASAIKKVDSRIKVAYEYGGVTDDFSVLRSTLAFKNLSQKADILKTSAAGIQADICTSNLQAGQKYYSEVASWDQGTQQELKDYVHRSMVYGTEYFSLYNEYVTDENMQKFRPAIQEAVRWINTPVSTSKVETDSVSYRVSSLIDNFEAVVKDWEKRTDKGKKRIFVHLEEDLIYDNENFVDTLKLPPPRPVDTTSTVTPPPTATNPSNSPPEVGYNYAFEATVGQSINEGIPNNLFKDPDGFIAFIKIVSGPEWLFFNQFENKFFGVAEQIGTYKVRLQICDNSGNCIESAIDFAVSPPNVKFEVIRDNYFDEPIESFGSVVNNRLFNLADFPFELNFLLNSNIDSVDVQFILNGAMHFERYSSQSPHSLFRESRALKLPVGDYTLEVKLFKKGEEQTVQNRIVHFKVRSDNNETIDLDDWTGYPNPFGSTYNVKIPNEYDLTKVTFTIVDLKGATFYVKPQAFLFSSDVVSINLESIITEGGIYFLRVEADGKLIKQHKIVKR